MKLREFAVPVLFTLLFSTHAAFAGVSEFGAGVSAPTLLGTLGAGVNQVVGFQAEVALRDIGLGEGLDLRIDGTYLPYTLKSASGVNLNMVGGFIGLQTRGSAFAGISPFVSLEVGGVYDWLGLSGTSATDAGLNFAAQFVPGVDVPLFRKLGLMFELPVVFVASTSSLFMWNGSASLRWEL